jgi:hypothetical protein
MELERRGREEDSERGG